MLGRIAPEKGVDRAIRIAIRCGIPLKIAAKVDRADQDYYDEHDPADDRSSAGGIYRRDRRPREIRISSAARSGCWCRSTGRSRSAW